ncbi:Homeobox protein knotted-1-like 1 [Platanthera guangdongensis]|uniref:Homeobox protein knotted-1-like 1 n=1 Tax=Platanthera guangdongensis TaxID=2320717 RepID=A0ABR2M659_9ASPA
MTETSINATHRSIQTADDEKCGAACSDSQEGLFLDSNSGGETVMEDKIWADQDRELKNQLLKKYSSHKGSLRQELSKKRKKLPKEARQKLLGWRSLTTSGHILQYCIPESKKKALAQSTGINEKQIDNWFINQRKLHWKPSEEMQFMVFDGHQYQQQQNSSSFFMKGCFMGDGSMYPVGT